jgi:farnesyl diphosphate synthase
LIERLADASGAKGMVGGQMIDMLEEESPRDLNTITRMQRLKTGALISYSVEAAGIIGGANEHARQALAGFAQDLGLAYQIADDLLDVEGDQAVVGKTLRRDEISGKANFVTVLGVEGARERVRLLAAQAKQHLAFFREKANILLQSVDYVLDRTR